MANVPESPVWESGVYQFETTDLIQGGPGGTDNIPHQQLGNRTKWLYDNKLSRDGSQAMTGGLVVAPSAGNALELQTPNGVNTVLRLAQASQTGATIRAIAGSVLTFSVDSGAGNTERMRIDANGRIGIGTTSPDYPLDVRGAEPMISVRKPAANSNYYGYNIMAGTDILSSWLMNTITGEVQFTAGYNGFGGVFKWNTNGVERMRIRSDGLIGIGTDDPKAALNVTKTGSVNTNGIFRWTDATISTGYLSVRNTVENGVGIGSDGRISFSTGQNGALNAFNERMTITSSGSVGLGTSSPLSRFDIAGGDNQNVTSSIRTGLNASAILSLAGGGGGLGTSSFDLSGGNDAFARLWNYANAGMIFATNNAERMRITPAGAIGVGTASPAYKFHVEGGGVGIVVGSGSDVADGGRGFWCVANTGTYNGFAWQLGAGNQARLLVGDGGGSWITRLTIDQAGILYHGTPAAGASGSESVNAAWSRTYVEGRVQNVLDSVAAGYYAKSAWSQSHATNGWLRLPNGTILQWGQATPPSSAYQDWSVGFPISFPNACLNFQISDIAQPADGGFENANHVKSISVSSALIRQDWIGDNVNGNVRATSMFWFAIGY